MSDTKDFFKALGLFLGVPFVLFSSLMLVREVAFCKAAIEGRKKEIGARVYINGKFAGVIEKFRESEYVKGITFSRLCTWFKKGDLIRVEKEGYQTYTATLDPYVDDSGPPDYVVRVKLVPLGETEKPDDH